MNRGYRSKWNSPTVFSGRATVVLRWLTNPWVRIEDDRLMSEYVYFLAG